MRSLITLLILLAGASLCRAQTVAAEAAGAKPTQAAQTAVESRTERIVVEDAGSRIDELRVGGETRRITVAPKGGMPAYQIEPQRGERSWKVLSF